MIRTDPVNMILKTGVTVKGPGKIVGVKDTSGVRLTANGANEIAIGITAGDSSRAAGGALETAAGATVAVYPLGGVLMVQSKAGDAYTTGCTVYVGANGLATSTAGSNKKLGLYVGKAHTAPALVDSGAGDGLTDAGVTGTATTEGGMIPVMTAGAAIA